MAVQYHADPTLWHERIVLCHLGGGQLLLLTPNHDLISESIAGSGEIKASRDIRSDRSVRGISRDDLYLFEDQQGMPDELTVNEYIDEAKALARLQGYPVAGEPPDAEAKPARPEPALACDSQRSSGGLIAAALATAPPAPAPAPDRAAGESSRDMPKQK